MATAPVLQVMYRRVNDINFGWKPLNSKDVSHYNIYASSTEAGTYALIKSNISNSIAKDTVYKRKVTVIVKDSEVGIPYNTVYYFKLTFVDRSGSESALVNSNPKIVYPAGVELPFENESDDRNNHNYGWDYDGHVWRKLKTNPDGTLVTDATVNIGDITLGNVKVAARSDNTTLEYLHVRDDRVLFVKPLDEFDTITSFDSDTISGAAENTILTYSNANSFYLTRIICSGTATAVFKVKVNGSTVAQQRNSWNDRNTIFDFGKKGIEIGAGISVTITAFHIESTNQSYESGLVGYRIL